MDAQPNLSETCVNRYRSLPTPVTSLFVLPRTTTAAGPSRIGLDGPARLGLDSLPVRTVVGSAIAGAVLMAAGSWWLGAVPIDRHPDSGVIAHVAFYLGLFTMIAAWLELGRRLLSGDTRITPRLLRGYVLGAAAPFLFAAPFGRDLWAYAAQGNLVRRGLDPYGYGPAAVPSAFTDEMRSRWLDTPSPYGPLWLRISHAAASITGGHPTVAVLLLRLPAFAALALILWALPVLARAVDGWLTRCLWLGVASPLTIVLGIGGGHNDVLMVALTLVGLAIATRPGLRALAVGAAVIGIAVMIKSPAALAVPFTVPLWMWSNNANRSLRQLVRACAAAGGAAAASIGLVTVLCGLGFGWVHQVKTNSPWVTWLSFPSAAAALSKLVTGSTHDLTAIDATMRNFRTAGEMVTILIAAICWIIAVRRGNPLGYLALALGCAATLPPAVQPWYYIWGLALAGLVVLRRRVIIALAAASLVFPVMITPSGKGHEGGWAAIPILACALLVSWFALRHAALADAEPTATEAAEACDAANGDAATVDESVADGSVADGSAADDDRADHARAEMGTDHGAQLGHV